MFYPTTFRKACQGEISTQKRKVLKYAKRQLSGTFPGRHSLLKDRIAETQNPALAFQFQRNVGRIKSFTRFFSKNRGGGEGRALSQALICRTSEVDHSFATDNEACAAPKKCSKKTFSTASDVCFLRQTSFFMKKPLPIPRRQSLPETGGKNCSRPFPKG